MLAQFQIDRWHKPPDFGPVVSTQIHLFSDASTMGYRCAAYLSLQDDTNLNHCSFLMDKTRLAPITIVTVSQLELTAATVFVRMGQMLFEELEVEHEITVYQTESTMVLRYLLQIVFS